MLACQQADVVTCCVFDQGIVSRLVSCVRGFNGEVTSVSGSLE
jgi:hypothetical protein